MVCLLFLCHRLRRFLLGTFSFVRMLVSGIAFHGMSWSLQSGRRLLTNPIVSSTLMICSNMCANRSRSSGISLFPLRIFLGASFSYSVLTARRRRSTVRGTLASILWFAAHMGFTSRTTVGCSNDLMILIEWITSMMKMSVVVLAVKFCLCLALHLIWWYWTENLNYCFHCCQGRVGTCWFVLPWICIFLLHRVLRVSHPMRWF